MHISGVGRELLEGYTSLFAVFVLLYVGFWLHRQTEIKRWKHFLEVKVQGFLDGKKLWGLAAISFVAVFREAIETILFLRAIWLDSTPTAQHALTAGVLSSLALVIFLSWLALNLSARLPLRQLFSLSSLIMLALATILTGKGIHSFQETGILGATMSPFNFHIDLLGIYPTLESVVGQIAVFMLVLVIWYANKRSTQSARNVTPTL